MRSEGRREEREDGKRDRETEKHGRKKIHTYTEVGKLLSRAAQLGYLGFHTNGNDIYSVPAQHRV